MISFELLCKTVRTDVALKVLTLENKTVMCQGDSCASKYQQQLLDQYTLLKIKRYNEASLPLPDETFYKIHAKFRYHIL